MSNLQDQTSGNITVSESVLRIVVGIALILVTLDTAITNDLNLSYPMLIGSYVVLTGITCWDPVYALLSSIFTKNTTKDTTKSEYVSNSASA